MRPLGQGLPSLGRQPSPSHCAHPEAPEVHRPHLPQQLRHPGRGLPRRLDLHPSRDLGDLVPPEPDDLLRPRLQAPGEGERRCMQFPEPRLLLQLLRPLRAAPLPELGPRRETARRQALPLGPEEPFSWQRCEMNGRDN